LRVKSLSWKKNLLSFRRSTRTCRRRTMITL
jgi:hypothetical protein